MNRKVILLKSNFHKKGGLEKYAWRIAQAFADKNYEVEILTTGPLGSMPTAPSISFHPFKTHRFFSFLHIKQFDYYCQKFLKEKKASIIFGMDRNSYQTHIRAGNGSHVAFLKSRLFTDSLLKKMTIGLNPLNKTILEIEKKSFESPFLQKLITNSHMVKNEILNYYKVPPEKIEVIHNGVEWKEIEHDFLNWEEEKIKTAAKTKLDPHLFHFLFIGNGYLRKGLKPLLVALSRLKPQDFHLTVIGKEKKIQDYINLAKKLNLQDKVSFLGPQKDVKSFYQLADCLVIPSFYDPFANVTIEALAMGLFIISSKTNGAHEILSLQNGIIIEDLLNPEELKTALETALKRPKTRENSLKIRRSIEHLDFSSQLTKLLTATTSTVSL